MSDNVLIMQRKEAQVMSKLRDTLSYPGCQTLNNIATAIVTAVNGYNYELHVFWKDIDRSKYPSVFYPGRKQHSLHSCTGATEADMRLIQRCLLDTYGYDVTEVIDEFGPRFKIRWGDKDDV